MHIIHGEADYVIPISEGQEMAGYLPTEQVHFKKIPYGSHAVMRYPEFWEWFTKR
ncbi:MAG: alpha/beta fold hydrolase [Bacteroidia bacterium]